jgi:hypothetical protein
VADPSGGTRRASTRRTRASDRCLAPDHRCHHVLNAMYAYLSSDGCITGSYKYTRLDKHFSNDPSAIVREALDGFVAVNPQLRLDTASKGKYASSANASEPQAKMRMDN